MFDVIFELKLISDHRAAAAAVRTSARKTAAAASPHINILHCSSNARVTHILIYSVYLYTTDLFAQR